MPPPTSSSARPASWSPSPRASSRSSLPCVLPLVPGYLSFVSGVGFDELGARPRRRGDHDGCVRAGLHGDVRAARRRVWPGSATRSSSTGARSRSSAGAFMIAMGLVLAGPPAAAGPGRRATPPRGERRRATPLRGSPASLRRRVVALHRPDARRHPHALARPPAAEPPTARSCSTAYSLGLGVPFLLFGLAFTRVLGLVRLDSPPLACGVARALPSLLVDDGRAAHHGRPLRYTTRARPLHRLADLDGGACGASGRQLPPVRQRHRGVLRVDLARRGDGRRRRRRRACRGATQSPIR